eukprot:gene7564-9638_t
MNQPLAPKRWFRIIPIIPGAHYAANKSAKKLIFISLILWGALAAATGMERSRANTFLILGNPVTVLWMSVLSGYLIDAMGWRW